jgi:hypothetical protein
MKKKLYLAVAYHKEHFTLNETKKYFNPIHVGKANSKLELGIDSDDGKDSISSKNANYCELTALYHMWKNVDSDYYGLMHYRRYFSLNEDNLIFKKVKFFMKLLFSKDLAFHQIKLQKDTNDFISNMESLHNHIEDLLLTHDILLPKKVQLYKLNMKEYYGYVHNIEDYNKIESLIIAKYPEMEQAVFESANLKEMYAYNMFITNKEVFQDYMEWLFDILFEFEKDYKFIGNIYQDRVFGFLSERMLNIYLTYNKTNIKIKELNTIMVD